MKLTEKITRVHRAYFARLTPWPIRVLLLSGLFALGVIPLAVFGSASAAIHAHWVSALGSAVTVPVMATFWGAAWRRAVDVPMGDAWFDLPTVTLPLALGYAILAGLNAYQRRWGWAALDAGCAWVYWRGGRGGGGWDDPVDAPKPDPAASA